MKLDLVVLTGMSGSGKSVALHALEDAGYYCVDNLPPELLAALLMLEDSKAGTQMRRLAVSVDARSASSLHILLPVLDTLRDDPDAEVRSLFLDASDLALVRRYSESRRPHPLQGAMARALHPDGGLPRNDAQALIDTIELERELLAPLRERSATVDTTLLRPAQLRTWLLNMVQAPNSRLTLVFQSFAFKHGVPLDSDFVFDARMLPNPHYIKDLKPLTGKDEAVQAYLRQQPEADKLIAQIEDFLRTWLPTLEHDQRSYVTVAIGCTGGQHRSVYCVEQLMKRFAPRGAVLSRHREQDGK